MHWDFDLGKTGWNCRNTCRIQRNCKQRFPIS